MEVISYPVIIDGKQNQLTLAYHAHGSKSWQYNTEKNVSAHTFNIPLSQLPKNIEIKTNGHTYVIL